MSVVKLPYPKVLDNPTKTWLMYYPEISPDSPKHGSQEEMDISDSPPSNDSPPETQDGMDIDNDAASADSKASCLCVPHLSNSEATRDSSEI
jgi:hypothetical protein